jgi:hypothetical protein
MSTKLMRALRAKYRTPRDVVRALGLDESLLDVKHLAFDAKPQSGRDMAWSTLAEHVRDLATLEKARRLFAKTDDDGELLVSLDHLLAEELDGATHKRVQELIHHHLGGHKYDGAASDADEDRNAIERAVDQVENLLGEHGLTEDDLFELRPLLLDYARDRSRRGGRDRARDELPENGLTRPGGRLGQDRKSIDAAMRLFPEAARIGVLDGGDFLPPASAMDEASQRKRGQDIRDAYALFPDARRIGVA